MATYDSNFIPTIKVPCPICKKHSNLIESSGRDFDCNTTGDQIFKFLRCLNCDILFLSPRPEESSLPIIYSKSEYYSYSFTEKMNFIVSYAKFKRDHDKVSIALSLLASKNPKNMRILDIGSGDGSFLSVFLSNGVLGKNLYGVELNLEACEHLMRRGFNPIHGQIEKITLPSANFDCITLIQVIEHVANPLEVLKKLHESLALDGILVLETPNFSSWDRPFFRKSTWGGYHFPRHWTLWNKKSITKTLEIAGYKVINIETPAAAVLWIWSLNHVAQLYLGNGNVASFLSMKNPVLLGVMWMLEFIPSLLGLSANMRIIASRK